MRILFVDAFFRSMNPTRSHFPQLVSRAGETEFFGPGYVSGEVLARGLKDFVRRRGPFDVVVASDQIVLGERPSDPKGIRTFLRNNHASFPAEHLSYVPQMRAEFGELTALKVALIWIDYYNMPSTHLDLINGVGPDLIIGFGEEFLAPVGELFDVVGESIGAGSNDNWLNFVRANRRRMIPLAHFVADDEFDYTPLAERKADWCVPGTPYAARRVARKSLKEAGVRFSRQRSFLHPQVLAAVATRLGVPLYSNPTFLSVYQDTFRQEIRQARFAFTCGSALRWPLRKFFEIPANGTVLACEPCNGFEALGFRDGENAIVVEAQNVDELSEKYGSRDTDALQQIAEAGRRLIERCHTLSVRGEQLRDALEAAVAGRWNGAKWRDGRMEAAGHDVAEPALFAPAEDSAP
jgi:hypothetical protein